MKDVPLYIRPSRPPRPLTNRGTRPVLKEKMEILLAHPDIGTIKGKKSAGVAQFLGIKYAALTDRLAPPTLVTSYPANSIDATAYGCAPNSLLCLMAD